ncbi:hypothetical protein DL98DRAFT_572460 [Cadophora sp. DSE1049]|nr:hypothetical protein DL98DRAFT_572460 [Cadophora sp. DSE1049]
MPPKKASARPARKSTKPRKSTAASTSSRVDPSESGNMAKTDKKIKKKPTALKGKDTESTSQPVPPSLASNTAPSTVESQLPHNMDSAVTTDTNASGGVTANQDERRVSAVDFPKFRKLPTELRVKIWKEQFPGPRMIQVYDLGPWQTAYQRPSKRSHQLLFKFRTTCKEFNGEILRKYRLITFADMGMSLSTAPMDPNSKYPFILVDDKQDTIHFSISIVWAHYDGRPQVAPKIYSSLRSVAMPRNAVKHLYTNKKTRVLGNWFEGITGLQKFSMVGDGYVLGDWNAESPGCFSVMDTSNTEEPYCAREFREAMTLAIEARPSMSHMAGVLVQVMRLDWEWDWRRTPDRPLAYSDVGENLTIGIFQRRGRRTC